MLTKDGPSEGWVYFTITELEPITEELCKLAQAEAGYPVAGYGFYTFHTFHDRGGHYVATWRCQASTGA